MNKEYVFVGTAQLKTRDYINQLEKENKELKKQLEVGKEQYNDLVEEKEILQEQLSSNTLQLEELKEQVSKGLYSTCLPYRTGYDKAVEEMENQQKEFIKYLENEKDRLARECSNIYEDSLGKTRFVNEDIFNEVDTILLKYKEIIGGKDVN